MSFNKMMHEMQEIMKKVKIKNKKPTAINSEEVHAVFPKSEERPFQTERAYKIELFKQVEAIKKAWTLISIYKDDKTQNNMIRLIRAFKETSDEVIVKKITGSKNFYDAIKAFDNAITQFEDAEKFFNNPPKFETSLELVDKREDESNFMICFEMYKKNWADKIDKTLNEHGRKENRDKPEEQDKDRVLIDRILKIAHSVSEESDENDCNASEDELIYKMK